jgi:endonuclease/exonuclease/phosphatase family metal-dependent hydrolase
MFKRLSFIVGLCLLLNSAAAWAHADADKRDVTVMTRNMDAGSDLEWFFVTDVTTATTLTFNEVLASNIPARATLLADEIGTAGPDLIGLQEVTLWQAGPLGGNPTIVLDQLQLLLNALAVRNLHYAPVAVNTLTSVAAPTNTGLLVSFTDRDVILARTDLKQSELSLSNIQKHIYQAKFGFPIAGTTVPVLRGFISVDAKVRGKVFRFIDTHLETLIQGIPDTNQTQVAQANELLDFVRTTSLPVVLAGDFNSNAEQGPDHSASTDNIVAFGFTDTWHVFNPPGGGFTWPLFLEDFNSGTPVVPVERIDLIFARYLNVLQVHRTGLNAPWPSDHLGVVSTVQLEP